MSDSITGQDLMAGPPPTRLPEDPAAPIVAMPRWLIELLRPAAPPAPPPRRSVLIDGDSIADWYTRSATSILAIALTEAVSARATIGAAVGVAIAVNTSQMGALSRLIGSSPGANLQHVENTDEMRVSPMCRQA